MRSVDTLWRSLKQRSRIATMAASLGLEPRQRDPESLVLPLHHEARSEKIRTDLPCCKSRASRARFKSLAFSRRARSLRLLEPLLPPRASRSSRLTRARVPPFYQSSRRHDSDRDGKAGADAHPQQAPAKPHY